MTEKHPRASRSILLSPRLWILAVVIIGLAVVHQSNLLAGAQIQPVLDIVPYVPIILGGIWFGLAGGVLCALLTSVCFLVHLGIHGGGGFFGAHLHRTLDILMFNVVGVVTGLLAQRQFKLMRRYRATAEKLEASYAELREKTEALIRSEEELSRANRLSALGELTASLAHEIGNPLGAIKGAAEIVADGLDPADRKGRFGQLLLKEVNRLDSVVRSFLGYARKEADSGGSPPSADLGRMLRDVAALVQPQCDRSGISLELDLEEPLAALRCQPSHLQQVFLNLVLNAVQATPAGGRIRITTSRCTEGIAATVEDSGPGIPPGLGERIFEPFFTTRGEGTGLGLAIARRIVSGYGGSIEAKSRPEGGAAFRVTFPVEESAFGEVGSHRG
jgi:signal transduction histidine kinase